MARRRYNTVPSAITPAVRLFCSTLSSEEPAFLRSIPVSGGRSSACFDNVKIKVRKHGGSVVFGWAIWHLPSVYFEAEHHAVWRNNHGILIDVSPQLNGFKTIVFVGDSSAPYDPSNPRANVMQAASDDSRALEVARLGNERAALWNRYRAMGTGPIEMDPGDHQLEHQLVMRMKALIDELAP